MLLKKMQITLRSKILKIKYLNITNLATNASLNAKINEVEGEIHNITNLIVLLLLLMLKIKKPSVSNLVKKD